MIQIDIYQEYVEKYNIQQLSAKSTLVKFSDLRKIIRNYRWLYKNVKNIKAIVPPTGPVDPHKYGFNPISLEEGMDLIKPNYVYEKIKKFI